MEISGNAKKTVVRTDRLSRGLGRSIRIPLHMPTTESTSDLAGDLFQTLWQRNPEVLPTEKVDVMRGVNRTIIEKYMAEQTFQTARHGVQANLPAAIACTQTTWSAIADDDYLKSAIEEQKQADKKEEQADQADQEADDLEQQAEQRKKIADQARQDGDDQLADHQEKEAEVNSKTAELFRKQAQDMHQQAEAMAQKAADKIADKLDKPMGKAALQNAAKEGQKEAEETAEFMKSWGLSGNDVNAEDATKLLDFKKSADEISKLVGRMKGIAKRQIDRVKNETIGPVSEPSYTKDIRHLFPTELAKLSPQAPAVLRVQALNSLFNGSGMLGWKPKITGEHEGHILGLLDCSPSMGWGSSPSPFVVAKSILIGIAMAAREDANRHWELGYFNDDPPDCHPYVTSKDGWQDVMEWARHGTSGGTQFSEALEFAIERIKNLRDKDEVGYDIAMLTDEQSDISDRVFAAFKALKAETGVRLHVVSINCGRGEGNKRLRELADTIFSTSAIGNAAGDITELIVTKIAQSSFGLD